MSESGKREPQKPKKAMTKSGSMKQGFLEGRQRRCLEMSLFAMKLAQAHNIQLKLIACPNVRAA
jgi:hypothetical protein